MIQLHIISVKCNITDFGESDRILGDSRVDDVLFCFVQYQEIDIVYYKPWNGSMNFQ